MICPHAYGTATVKKDHSGAAGWLGLARGHHSLSHPHVSSFSTISGLAGDTSGLCVSGGGDGKSGASNGGEGGGEGVGVVTGLRAGATGGGVAGGGG